MPVARSVINFANNYRWTVSSRLPGPHDRSDTLLIRSVKYGDWTEKFGSLEILRPGKDLRMSR
jgi:hypothetical protein